MDQPRRSQPTRDRILDAGRRLFAELGYERTTIRAVATAAGVHASMVMRYYESKEGLFAAAADFDLMLPDLSTLPPAAMGEGLVRHFLARWEGPGAGDELPALLRAAATHPRARARAAEIFEQQVAPAIASATATARAPETAALIGAQIVGLAFTRYVLRLPAVAALDPETIVSRVGATVQALLDGEPGNTRQA